VNLRIHPDLTMIMMCWIGISVVNQQLRD